jgi:hypothetical protein
MVIDIEVPATGNFREASTCDVEGLDSIGIADIDMA